MGNGNNLVCESNKKHLKRILPPLSAYMYCKGSLGARLFLYTLCSFLSLLAVNTHAQKISGQWIGGFTSSDDPSNSKTDYVLELESNGNSISGYSYTYFSMSGKRYYVICKLKGTFDASSKSMVVNEVETVKTNTPPDFQNCLQSHELTYFKKADVETLVGKWKPFEKGNTCGTGKTDVERKTMAGLKTGPTAAKTPTPSTGQKPQAKQLDAPLSKSSQTPSTHPVKPETKPTAPRTESNPPAVSSTERKVQVKPDPKTISPIESGMARSLTEKEKAKLTERSYQVIQTIEVNAPVIRVDIYDNGQVDGDTVSIYLNEKLLVPAKMLTAKPISIDIKINEKEDVYDLIMYAETLGTIPPNTALMVVTTPTNRYEINITSTEQTSGAVRFKVKR